MAKIIDTTKNSLYKTNICVVQYKYYRKQCLLVKIQRQFDSLVCRFLIRTARWVAVLGIFCHSFLFILIYKTQSILTILLKLATFIYPYFPRYVFLLKRLDNGGGGRYRHLSRSREILSARRFEMRLYLVHFDEVISESVPAGGSHGLSVLTGYDTNSRGGLLNWPFVSAADPPAMDHERNIARASLGWVDTAWGVRPCLVKERADEVESTSALVIWWSSPHHFIEQANTKRYIRSGQPDKRPVTTWISAVSVPGRGSGIMLQMERSMGITLLRTEPPGSQERVALVGMTWSGSDLVFVRSIFAP